MSTRAVAGLDGGNGAGGKPGANGRRPPWRLPFGANLLGGGVRFRLWAPGHATAEAVLHGGRAVALADEGDGWFSGQAAGLGAGARYRFRLDGGEPCPDPASRSQPDGVHGASAVVDPHAFRWTDAAWSAPPLRDWVIYELHVGTATPEGTFDALVSRLPALRELGATAVELMPVAQFSGTRNWGYDAVYPYAPAACYGGPDGLKRLVDAAHGAGLAVVLDVVYNRLGPEGNYLPAITSGKIFDERRRSPWGAALNFDGDGCEPLREFFLQNALHWVHEYHVDGLRLDGTHAIQDESGRHFLLELSQRVRASAPRPVVLIAHDQRNENRLVLPPEEDGYALDAVWAEDFHHSMRRLLAVDRETNPAAYAGTPQEVATALRKGWIYEGQTYPPTGELRGSPAWIVPPQAFVHSLDNHDEVGSRAFGERLHHEVDLARFRAASALLLLSPFTPLLWMGQEWAASSPFLYFTDYPRQLGVLVTRRRRDEFAGFTHPALRERIPDPQAEETFLRSRLDWSEREREPHRGVLQLHRDLLALRATSPVLRRRDRGSWRTGAAGGAVALRRENHAQYLLVIASFATRLRLVLPERELTRTPGLPWELALWTEEARFGGEGEARIEEGGVLMLTTPGAAVLTCSA